jgi:hypothetical protein
MRPFSNSMVFACAEATLFSSLLFFTPSFEYAAPAGAAWFGAIAKYFFFSSSV